MWKRIRSALLCFGALATAFALWCLDMVLDNRSMSPPPGADTLTEFAARMPPPTHLTAIEEAGETRILWVGRYAYSRFDSGPSYYLFDASGKLIEWRVSGDRDAFSRHGGANYTRMLTVDEAIRLTKEARESSNLPQPQSGSPLGRAGSGGVVK
jgi:hypothetical protein